MNKDPGENSVEEALDLVSAFEEANSTRDIVEKNYQSYMIPHFPNEFGLIAKWKIFHTKNSPFSESSMDRSFREFDFSQVIWLKDFNDARKELDRRFPPILSLSRVLGDGTELHVYRFPIVNYMKEVPPKDLDLLNVSKPNLLRDLRYLVKQVGAVITTHGFEIDMVHASMYCGKKLHAIGKDMILDSEKHCIYIDKKKHNGIKRRSVASSYSTISRFVTQFRRVLRWEEEAIFRGLIVDICGHGDLPYFDVRWRYITNLLQRCRKLVKNGARVSKVLKPAIKNKYSHLYWRLRALSILPSSINDKDIKLSKFLIGQYRKELGTKVFNELERRVMPLDRWKKIQKIAKERTEVHG